MNLAVLGDYLAVLAIGVSIPSILSLLRLWRSTKREFLLYFAVYLIVLNTYFAIAILPTLVSVPMWQGPLIHHMRLFSWLSYVILVLFVGKLLQNDHVSKYKYFYSAYLILFLVSTLLYINKWLPGISDNTMRFITALFSYGLDFWLAFMMIFFSSTLSNGPRKAVASLGKFFLFTGVILAATHFLNLYQVIHIEFSTIIFFSVILVQNMLPFMFLGWFMRLYEHADEQDILQKQLNADFIRKINLSRREAEIAENICQGLSNKEIADKLFISQNTVKAHIYTIYNKAGVNNRVQLTNLIQHES